MGEASQHAVEAGVESLVLRHSAHHFIHMSWNVARPEATCCGSTGALRPSGSGVLGGVLYAGGGLAELAPTAAARWKLGAVTCSKHTC